MSLRPRSSLDWGLSLGWSTFCGGSALLASSPAASMSSCAGHASGRTGRLLRQSPASVEVQETIPCISMVELKAHKIGDINISAIFCQKGSCCRCTIGLSGCFHCTASACVSANWACELQQKTSSDSQLSSEPKVCGHQTAQLYPICCPLSGVTAPQVSQNHWTGHFLGCAKARCGGRCHLPSRDAAHGQVLSRQGYCRQFSLNGSSFHCWPPSVLSHRWV